MFHRVGPVLTSMGATRLQVVSAAHGNLRLRRVKIGYLMDEKVASLTREGVDREERGLVEEDCEVMEREWATGTLNHNMK
ncbi:hypothetical protein EVAR_26550_1 [Eumeta japonica]|uniref:Uncharacterized protein n=1 Tax=Eumeta variegata TaxID=151549 RepID=A0A4C1W7J1_EUMVA|nr:hypothetical protein EVAR_26550_1 [Eumeta japonica]